jgi:DNA-3-methyladenine glycosylase I
MRLDMTIRCDWLADDPMLITYHDEEWGVAEVDPRALWESLMLSGFQAGLSWLTILHKREAFRKAFEGFHPETVARYGKKEIARLMTDASIIRSGNKIAATITGAQIFLDMQEKGENFSDFVWSFVDHKQIQNHGPMPTQSPVSTQLSEALKDRGFKFVGPVIVYAWMQSVGMVNDHTPHCFRRKAVQTAAPLHQGARHR